MATLQELLELGCFPRELPPTFVTDAFANTISSSTRLIPSAFSSNRLDAQSSNHSIARVGKLRRKLNIPNPITHFRLCNEIASSWSEISPYINISDFTISSPRSIHGSYRALSPRLRYGVIPTLRSRYRMGLKYLLFTDIDNFYHSLYTHSIPWAIHTKSVAKMNRSSNLLGNRLDTLVRIGQDKQTVGIPIGPDTSLLFAEIILQASDQNVLDEFGTLTGFRYLDDYEICFSSLAEAEDCLRVIESALSHYELSLNPRKTRIISLPNALEDGWRTDLNQFEIRTTQRTQYNDLISYFSKAFDFSKRNPDSSILRYAIARLRSVRVEEYNWRLLQLLLLQCATSEAGTLPYIFEQFIIYHGNEYSFARNLLEETINSLIKYHAPLGHGSEVAWSLWGAIAFSVPLHSESANTVTEMDDSIVALLALDAEQRGLFMTPLDKSNWSHYMTRESLYEGLWLLSYEANVKGWLPSVGHRDHVMTDSCFRYLKSNGVEFYNIQNGCPMELNAILPLPGGSLSLDF